MKNNVGYDMPDGYRETIEKGIAALGYLGRSIRRGTDINAEQIGRLKRKIQSADAIVIGAGAGLSTAAGFTYSGERFEKYFYDFAEKYNIRDMYSGGFYPFPDEETRWAWWARHIYYNRYVDASKPVYQQLFKLIEGKDYFVITTNVDHQFQRAGFDKKRLFYTQGDYGLFQSVNPEIRETFDNEEWVMQAMEAQGFEKAENGIFQPPASSPYRDWPEWAGSASDFRVIRMDEAADEANNKRQLFTRIPTDLIPKCPTDGSDMVMNLRADDTFVEDDGWRRASAAYADFLRRHENLEILYLELGVGNNTPVIIKYPFWQMTYDNPKATYACLNFNESYCPSMIERQSLCIDGDIGEILTQLMD